MEIYLTVTKGRRLTGKFHFWQNSNFMRNFRKCENIDFCLHFSIFKIFFFFHSVKFFFSPPYPHHHLLSTFPPYACQGTYNVQIFFSKSSFFHCLTFQNFNLEKLKNGKKTLCKQKLLIFLGHVWSHSCAGTQAGESWLRKTNINVSQWPRPSNREERKALQKQNELKSWKGEMFCSELAMPKHSHHLKRVDSLLASCLPLSWAGCSDGLYLLSLVLLPMEVPVTQTGLASSVAFSPISAGWGTSFSCHSSSKNFQWPCHRMKASLSFFSLTFHAKSQERTDYKSTRDKLFQKLKNQDYYFWRGYKLWLRAGLLTGVQLANVSSPSAARLLLSSAG